MPLLEVKDLYKSFGNVKVLNGINLTLEPGKIYTLRGDNGSGKTTLLNILSGFMMPDRGSVQFNGQELVGMKPHAISRLGIKRTFQDLRIIRDMMENPHETDPLLCFLSHDQGVTFHRNRGSLS